QRPQATTRTPIALRDRVGQLVASALPSIPIERKWHHPEYDPHRIYSVDFSISAHKKPLLVFTPETDMECLQATVSCQHYRQMRFTFDSLAVIDESRHIANRYIISLKDA